MKPGGGSQRPSQTKCKERPSQKRARLLPCVGEGLEGSSARLVSALTARAVAGGAAGSGAHAAPTTCSSALPAGTGRTGRALLYLRCWRGSAESADERPISS